MTQLEQEINIWESFRSGYAATLQEQANLLMIASAAKDDHPSIWPRLSAVLKDHTELDAKAIRAEVRRARITADLGCYPYSVTEFIPAFLESRGYRMDYTGMFDRGGVQADANELANLMTIWNYEIAGGAPVFPAPTIQAAFENWKVAERAKVLRRAYSLIAFERDADGAELDRFAAHITAPVEGDPVATATAVRATSVALRNFIFRVKNHMRGRWAHSCHLMPVLTGKQGSGKSYAVEAFLKPLGELSNAVGFDMFGDTSREFQLSTMPVMFFDEMAGVGKADVEKLKGIMTLPRRAFREIYGVACTRYVMSTFIGCSNRDIATLIRDETGNRRFLQINTPNEMSRAEIDKFDMLAMWRSVDEDAAEPPMYAAADDLAAVQAQQSEQRYEGVVREWVTQSDDLPERATKVPEIFSQHFAFWAERMYPQQAKWIDLSSFRKELERLRAEELPDIITRTKPGNVVHYRFENVHAPKSQKVYEIKTRFRN